MDRPEQAARDPAGLDLAELEARASEAEAFLRSIASRHRLMILCSLLDDDRNTHGDGEARVTGRLRPVSDDRSR